MQFASATRSITCLAQIGKPWEDEKMDVAKINFDEAIGKVVEALVGAGYDPIAQLTGYLQTGDDTFITRTGDARGIIRLLDKEQIAAYVENNKPHEGGRS